MELSFPTTIAKTPDIVLDQIRRYIRKMRSVSLDRMEFEQCRQEFNESFDNDFIRLQRIANCADLFGECLEYRISTRLIVVICDPETRRKLLALNPFPPLQTAIDLRRSEEAAAENNPTLER